MSFTLPCEISLLACHIRLVTESPFNSDRKRRTNCLIGVRTMGPRSISISVALPQRTLTSAPLNAVFLYDRSALHGERWHGRRVRPTLHDYATIPLFRALPRGDLNVGALVGCCFYCKKLQVCALPYRDRPSQSHHNCMPMVLLTTERTYCRF